ncbi:hypothetical protein BD408DRAFT_431445 [Parasitella parasitica]|nr:hypothetical protein BD408DRAFT_431445 [Parasitella parasitica]
MSSTTHNKSAMSPKSIEYNINPLFWAPTLSDRAGKSAFPKSLFTAKALKENEFNPVSAVVLRVTDDDQSIEYAVKNLIKYPFISDIYIHNLVKERPLTVDSLKLDPKLKESIRIEIMEPDEDLGSMARFTTCATASRLYCYFQDDAYINVYMDTLYTNFLRFPTLIHANAKPSHYENQMKWRFYNKDLKLHTGYADFRYGAFVPRWKVQSFLTQLGKSGLIKDSIRQAEHYFAIWLNQYPWLLSNHPHTSKGDKATDRDIAYPQTLDRHTFDAIRHLQISLALDQSDAPQDYFERQEEEPSLEYRDVRSSCVNDRCLFMTNMDPFVRPSQVTFDYQNITSIPKLENIYDSMSIVPSSREWDEYSYQTAVDNDPNTCWNTIKNPKQNDYFGLILVGTSKVSNVVIDTVETVKQPEKQFSVSVLQSGETWIQCKVVDKSVSDSNRISFDLNCPNVKLFRAIKVTFKKDQSKPFEICGLSIDNLSV